MENLFAAIPWLVLLVVYIGEKIQQWLLTNALNSALTRAQAQGITVSAAPAAAPAAHVAPAAAMPSAASATGIGPREIHIDVSEMVARTTNGAAPGSFETATNKVMVKTFDFNNATQQFIQFRRAMPKSWDCGPMAAVFYWSHPSTSTHFGVVWSIDAVFIPSGTALDVAFGTEQTADDTGGTTDFGFQSPETAPFTVAGSPTKDGGDVIFRIHRNVADAFDDMSVAARLSSVKLIYTTDADTDA